MLKIKIPDQPKEQLWDEINECFIYRPGLKGCELTLEHSLLSISKWESIWCKPFLEKKDKTVEEFLSYIECMTISPSNVDPELYRRMQQSDLKKIGDYIDHPASATTIGGSNGRSYSTGEVMTSELIYFYMTHYNISWDSQKWHLNRLLNLIKVCEIKNDSKGQKKMSANEIRKNYDKINEARRKALHTKG